MSIHWSHVLSLLILVLVANGAPVLLAILWGGPGRPLDGGRRLGDGRPLLGPSKTWRGLLASLGTTPLAAWILGYDWPLGLAAALGAMTGDLLASFAKRRLGLASGASVPVLDQVPEALLPILLVGGGLSWPDMALVVLGFTLLDLILTPLAVAGRRRRLD